MATDQVTVLRGLGDLLEAGATVPDAVSIATPDTDATRQAVTALQSGETLADALTSAGILDRELQPTLATFEQLPRPWDGLRQLADSIALRDQVVSTNRGLRHTWATLGAAVSVFAALAGLAASKTSALPWYATAAAWIGVSTPALVFLISNYRHLAQLRGPATAPQDATSPVQHARHVTWARALAVMLEARASWEHATTVAEQATAAVWGPSTGRVAVGHLPGSLATVLRVGEHTATTSALLQAWAHAQTGTVAAALQENRNRILTSAVLVLTASLGAYCLLLALPSYLA